jgi:hypothetical protein
MASRRVASRRSRRNPPLWKGGDLGNRQQLCQKMGFKVFIKHIICASSLICNHMHLFPAAHPRQDFATNCPRATEMVSPL